MENQVLAPGLYSASNAAAIFLRLCINETEHLIANYSIIIRLIKIRALTFPASDRDGQLICTVGVAILLISAMKKASSDKQ